MPFITQEEGKCQQLQVRLKPQKKAAATDQEQAEFFMTTSRGRGYSTRGAASFSGRWEQDVLLDYRSR